MLKLGLSCIGARPRRRRRRKRDAIASALSLLGSTINRADHRYQKIGSIRRWRALRFFSRALWLQNTPPPVDVSPCRHVSVDHARRGLTLTLTLTFGRRSTGNRRPRREEALSSACFWMAGNWASDIACQSCGRSTQRRQPWRRQLPPRTRTRSSPGSLLGGQRTSKKCEAADTNQHDRRARSRFPLVQYWQRALSPAGRQCA